MRKLFLILSLQLCFTQLSVSQENGKVQFYMVSPKQSAGIIRVGGAEADINGFTSKAIQIAIDALSIHGGGTVKLMPGRFEIMAPVRLTSNINLIGSGPETVLHKTDGVQTNFVIDADYGELKLTVADPDGFLPGMGVQVYDKVQMEECWNVTTAVITAVEGNVLYIDNFLVRDYHQKDEGIVSNACPVISAISVENIRIADLTVDGNKESNDRMNGCVGGGIYLHKTKNAVVENCIVKNWNGDGISWQITENVTVRNNEILGCTNYGMHPGTGSPGSLIEGNNSHHNDSDGLFVCWRVQKGRVRKNQLHDNGGFGICTGHKDSDMLYVNNHIYNNHKAGINLRKENAANAPHHSTFRQNLIENNGTYGILVESPASDVVIEDNTIRDTGQGTQTIGVYLSERALPAVLNGNKFSGLKEHDVITKVKK